MNKILLILALMAVSGCASINVPNYVKDEHPYKRSFYAPFEKVRAAADGALAEYGWTVIRESDPALFEVDRASEGGAQPQTLMFTEIRQTNFFVGSKYTRLNAFLRPLPDGAIEVEIRYLGISSILFKKSYQYRNDRAVNRIMAAIEQKIK